MVRPDSPDLVGDIGHRGDTTDGRPPPGITAAPGSVQGGALNLATARLAAVPELQGDLGRRGDLSGGQPFRQPADPYATSRPHDLKSSWEWLSFCTTLPADPVTFPSISAGFLLETGRSLYLGCTYKNTAGTAGDLQVLDGMDAGGALVDRVQTAASVAVHNAAPTRGVLCEMGIFLIPTTITIQGTVWVVHLWKYPFTPPGE